MTRSLRAICATGAIVAFLFMYYQAAVLDHNFGCPGLRLSIHQSKRASLHASEALGEKAEASKDQKPDSSGNSHNLQSSFYLSPWGLPLSLFGFIVFAYGYWQAKFGSQVKWWALLVLLVFGLLCFAYGFGVLVQRSLERHGLNVQMRFSEFDLSFDHAFLRSHQIDLALHRFGLFFKPAQTTKRDQSSYDSNESEGKVRDIVRRNQRLEVRFRIICMPVFLTLGCWLVYIGDLDGTLGWRRIRVLLLLCLGGVLIALSFACGFLPVYWQEKYHPDGLKRIESAARASQKTVS